MSADLNTWLTLKGTTEELASMLKVLKKFETENKVRYDAKRNCAYIEQVKVSGKAGERYLERMNDDDMQEYLAAAGRKLCVEASGPWGVLWPRDAGLLEALADAAPTAYLNGSIYGSVSGERIGHGGDLINGKLYLIDYTDGDVDDYDDDDCDDDEEADDGVERRVYDPETKQYSEGRFEKKCIRRVFVIAGKLSEFKDAQALEDYIEIHGGRVEEKVSVNTNCVISNDKAAVLSKNKKAIARGLAVLTETEFIERFGRL